MALRVRACGDTGLLLELGDNHRVHACAAAIRSADLAGIVDILPALETVLIVIDPASTSTAKMAAQLSELEVPEAAGEPGRVVEIPVQYDGDDLAWIAHHCGLDEQEVVAAHTGTPWRVAFCGFAPGFAYLIGGDPRLRVPRRSESRTAVPAGSVALAGEFSAVYPRRSPGGWQLLGRTELRMWDVDAVRPSSLTPGDEVVFREVSG